MVDLSILSLGLCSTRCVIWTPAPYPQQCAYRFTRRSPDRHSAPSQSTYPALGDKNLAVRVNETRDRVALILNFDPALCGVVEPALCVVGMGSPFHLRCKKCLARCSPVGPGTSVKDAASVSRLNRGSDGQDSPTPALVDDQFGPP